MPQVFLTWNQGNRRYLYTSSPESPVEGCFLGVPLSFSARSVPGKRTTFLNSGGWGKPLGWEKQILAAGNVLESIKRLQGALPWSSPVVKFLPSNAGVWLWYLVEELRSPAIGYGQKFKKKKTPGNWEGRQSFCHTRVAGTQKAKAWWPFCKALPLDTWFRREQRGWQITECDLDASHEQCLPLLWEDQTVFPT